MYRIVHQTHVGGGGGYVGGCMLVGMFVCLNVYVWRLSKNVCFSTYVIVLHSKTQFSSQPES